MKTTKTPWFWSREALLEYLVVKNAKSAGKGRPTPISALVVARLEGAL